MDKELTLAIIQSVAKYGPSAVTAIAEALKNKDVSADDIEKLFIEKEPEEYFEEE